MYWGPSVFSEDPPDNPLENSGEIESPLDQPVLSGDEKLEDNLIIDSDKSEEEIATRQQSKRKTKKSDCFGAIIPQCCLTHCVSDFKISEVRLLRLEWLNKSGHQKKEWLKTIFEHSTKKFNVLNRTVCGTGFRRLYNICSSSFYATKHLVKHQLPIPAPFLPLKKSVKKDNCISWLQSYIDGVGDLMPDNHTIHLPMYFRWNNIYQDMVAEMEEIWTTEKLPSLNCFYKCVKAHFRHVRRPRMTRLGKCDTCVTLAHNLNLSQSHQQKQQLRKLQDDHTKLHRAERLAYHQRRDQSFKDPSEILSMIIDASSPMFLPHVAPFPKGFCRAERLKVMIYGLINHSIRKKFLYLLLPTWDQQGPNLTLTILFHQLLQMKSEGRLPKQFFLQLDNCYKENKNKYLFGALAFLVHIGWFDSVQISFLIAGHTHEDVDQLFSTFAVPMKETSVSSLPQFIEYLDKWYPRANSRPTAIFLTCLYDFKTWLEPHLARLEGHSKPHSFLFKKDVDGDVKLWYRDYCSSKEDWQGDQNNNGVALFIDLPQSLPSQVNPTVFTEHLITKMQENLKWAFESRDKDWFLTLIEDKGLMIGETFEFIAQERPQLLRAEPQINQTTTSRVSSVLRSKSSHIQNGSLIFLRESENSNRLILGRVTHYDSSLVIINVARISQVGERLHAFFPTTEPISLPLSFIEKKNVTLTQKDDLIQKPCIKEMLKRGFVIPTFSSNFSNTTSTTSAYPQHQHEWVFEDNTLSYA
eukprot:TRINITY_DN75_c0_g1_i3.p1 TRINITY_DN75_c0_g1~~TRINITY_DN75_c0_g1_i3.p1  ORF type:complete len:751 (-),score=109.78 TRINITY_DN75_c0_g1_i3:31-2283(-)